MKMLGALLFVTIAVAQPGAITRFEQNDSRITYTGTWYPNSSNLNSAGLQHSRT